MMESSEEWPGEWRGPLGIWTTASYRPQEKHFSIVAADVSLLGHMAEYQSGLYVRQRKE